MVIAEGMNPIGLCKFGLGKARLWYSKVVEAEIRWNVRLIMTPKRRSRFGYVPPFGEARSPPVVVLRYGMKLR